jgi:hypothetical protein
VAKDEEYLVLHVRPLDTVDALGRQRFKGMDSNFIGRFQGTHGYFKDIHDDWGQRYGFKTGIHLVSEHSVSQCLDSYTPRSQHNEKAPRDFVPKLSSQYRLGQGYTRSPHGTDEAATVSLLK